MFKALLKKQLLEFFSGFTIKGKDKAPDKKSTKIGGGFLLCFLLLTFSSMFVSMAMMLSPVLDTNEGWIYFSLFCILSVIMGIFGSVFMTYTSLYAAKDNDLLLSMPIPPSMILFSRIAGLYASTFCFQAMVFIPCTVVYFLQAGFSPSALFSLILSLVTLPVLSLSISMLLGLVIALFASKIRNKSAITVVFSIAFFIVYYFVAMKFNNIVNIIVYNSAQTGEWIKKYLYLFYALGKGIYGETVLLLTSVLFVLGVFFVVYKCLSRTFLKLATSEKGLKNKAYKEKKAVQRTPLTAFVRKELLFFKNTPAYILNCSLGSVMMLIFAVFVLVKNGQLPFIFESAGLSSEVTHFFTGIILCLIAATNNITSVSVSLEGRNTDIIHSMPCDVSNVFAAKIILHMIVTGIPLVISNIIVSLATGNSFILSALMIIMSLVFTFVCAETGLVINLIFPKMEWVNETVPIKQSLSSLLGMFSGFAVVVPLIIPYFFVMALFSDVLYVIFVIFVLLLLSWILAKWLLGKGVEKFKKL